MDNDDEFGEENPLKDVLNKFAAIVLKKTARDSTQVLGGCKCNYKKKYNSSYLNNLTIISLVRYNQ